MNGVEPVPFEPPGLIARLLGRGRERHAFVEIRNRLATTPILALVPEDIDGPLARHGASRDAARPELEKLYAMVMRHIVRRGETTDRDGRELAHLRRLFGLSEADVQAIERALLEDTFRSELRRAVGDTLLTDAEKTRLEALAARLQIPPDVARALREEEVTRVWTRVFDAAVVDRRLSADEERHLAELAANLGVTPRLSDATRRDLDRFRLLWRIEQGELPALDPGVPLEPGEVARARVAATCFESTAAPRPTHDRRVRLGRVVHWELDHAAPAGDAARWQPCGAGVLVLTPRRIVFAGGSDPRRVPIERVERFSVFRDGLLLEVDGARELLLVIQGDSEIVGTVLGVLLKEARG
jgi:envelope transporter Tic110